MPKPDLDTLKRLAEAATPGTWYDREDGSGVNNKGGAIFCSAEDAVFIAACNPTAVLALCNYVARLEAALESLSSDLLLEIGMVEIVQARVGRNVTAAELAARKLEE